MSSPYSDLERPPLRTGWLTRALVRDGGLWREVRVLTSTESTNAVVRAEAAEPEGLVVVAEQQTAGRGRLDRTWTSPPRAGLTFSALLKPSVPDTHWPLLPLVVGTAVAEATEAMTELALGLKWPNDILVDDRKLGGILIERVGPAAVVGVGINVTMSTAELPASNATSLLLAGAQVTDRQSLLAAVLRAIADRYEQWQTAADLSALRTAYADRCTTIGRDVAVALPDGSTLHGQATSIDAAGRLVVSTYDGQHALSSGDVLHVRPI
ncbi:MAG: biotin--[acetyl-CoA-carboxylase] ligase [Actinomycetes bacterium]